MLLPYRVKNPIKRFPIAVVCIIAMNLVVYALTTDYMLSIKRSVVENCGFALGSSAFLNFIPAVFLHGDVLHLVGNMWFLWVFGPPVEDRLGINRFLLVYFTAGLVGNLLQSSLDIALLGETRPIIGASGCIMGVLGAYWYIYSWSTVCVFYWFGLFLRGVWEVAAFWIVGLYLMIDLMQGMLFGGLGLGSGVAYFAHVGGGFSGLLICLAMRIKRDTEAVSQVKALQADSRDLSSAPLHALQAMLEQEPGNPEVIRAMVKPALEFGVRSLLDEAMIKAGPEMIDKDPAFVAFYIYDLGGDPGIYQPAYLIRLAICLERKGEPSQALATYDIICRDHASSPEMEMTLYRMALCYWNAYRDVEKARECLQQMAARFPRGKLTPFARDLWNQMIDTPNQ